MEAFDRSTMGERLRTRSSAGPEKLFEVQVAESFSKGAIVNIERFTIRVCLKMVENP